AVLILWEAPFMKRLGFLKLIPGPLVAVLGSTILAQVFNAVPSLIVAKEHLVSLPTPGSLGELIGGLHHPDLSALAQPQLWVTAFTIAIVASLETLLSIDAADKLDPLKRITPTNRELKAQGIGQIVAGLLGGLPVTAVIVRSSANVAAGARTKLSTILHGALLLVAVLAVPYVLNLIPLASLAAVLLVTGYKLCKPKLWKEMWVKGWDQFIPFSVTIVAILFTDLLRGIIAGIVVGVLFILRTNFSHSVTVMSEGDKYLVSLGGNVSFLNKAYLRRTFNSIPNGAYVLIDGTRAGFIDKDIVETMRDFLESSKHKGIDVEMKRSPTSNNPVFKTESASVDYSGSAIASL
ncbi:MAG TPA: SulP family inorganic anion transporter, partial [Myxococcota bacterium]|nr:SulP family inorganic anion transporter [Myxococcota bacterium]